MNGMLEVVPQLCVHFGAGFRGRLPPSCMAVAGGSGGDRATPAKARSGLLGFGDHVRLVRDRVRASTVGDRFAGYGTPRQA
jgi:hypothetical protein